MNATSIGPVAAEIHRRLTEALAPERLQVIDDSEKHRGHPGHDARGESHFSVTVVSAAFEGQNRVARQRMVNAALNELLKERVHALTMVTKAPSELDPPRNGEGDHAQHGGGGPSPAPDPGPPPPRRFAPPSRGGSL